MVIIPDPHVTVIALDDEQKSIPAADLYDSKSGQPAVKSVLVTDRGTNRQVFIALDQLPAQSQMDARYILVTDAQAATAAPVGDRR